MLYYLRYDVMHQQGNWTEMSLEKVLHNNYILFEMILHPFRPLKRSYITITFGLKCLVILFVARKSLTLQLHFVEKSEHNASISYQGTGTEKHHFEIDEHLWNSSTHVHMPGNQMVVVQQWYYWHHGVGFALKNLSNTSCSLS